MPKPFFQIFASGVDISSKLNGRGISLTVTDGVGRDSDTVAIEIDDQDGIIAPPTTGVVLTVIGGYLDGPQRNFGDYKVDNVTLKGYPQSISISAQAVDARGTPKQKAVKDFQVEDFPTYGDIYNEVAGKMGLQLAMSGDLKGIANPFEMQTEESELMFATRLGDKIDASVTVKSGRLVVAHRGKGVSVSGQSLPTIVVQRGLNLLTYSVSRKDKPKHSQVKATWFDRNSATVKSVIEKAGDVGPTFLLRDPFQSEAEAKTSAQTMAKNLQRGEASAAFEIDGTPSAQAEAYVDAVGIRSLVDGKWRAKTVTHSFSSSAPYKTSIECELPDT